MSTEDNKKKARRGVDAKKALSQAILELESADVIKSYSRRTKFTHPNYPDDPNRFVAPFDITLADGKRAIVFCTSSFKADRLKEQQWDAYNIKKIDKKVQFCWLVTSDDKGFGEDDIVSKINAGSTASALDKVLTLDDFCDRILDHYQSTVSADKFGDKAGKVFEILFSQIMGYKGNLAIFNDPDNAPKVGFQYDVFKGAMEFLGIDEGKVCHIDATRDIKTTAPGKPKADVLITFKFYDGTTRVASFSCKNTKAKKIQVCQFKPVDCANALDPNNQNLRLGLLAYGRDCTKKGMSASEIALLDNEMPKYKQRFLEWSIGGYHIPNVPATHVAEFIVARNRNTKQIYFHKTKELCKIIANDTQAAGTWGSGLNWTYQGKKPNRNPQVKINTKWLFKS